MKRHTGVEGYGLLVFVFARSKSKAWLGNVCHHFKVQFFMKCCEMLGLSLCLFWSSIVFSVVEAWQQIKDRTCIQIDANKVALQKNAKP